MSFHSNPAGIAVNRFLCVHPSTWTSKMWYCGAPESVACALA
jgi:hypothetical protein